MSLNHHILAKAVTDEVLVKFKKTEWQCANGCGQDFYRVGTSADFPSPDAAFFDPTNKVIVSFEFKPPTETKRGILTGVGQSIAYLQTSNLSYLIAPRMLEDFQIGKYLSDLFLRQILGKIPIGLIIYDNNDYSQVNLEHNVENIEAVHNIQSKPKVERFWAKHQDLPIPLFHLILHYYYQKSTHMIDGDPFAACWRERMISPTVLTHFNTQPVFDLSGKPIMTIAGRKQITFLEKILNRPNVNRVDLEHEIDTEYSGDNNFNSTKKNFISFLKNMQMVDSENCLTESGFKLYHLGLVNGSTSKIFTDYFIKELLTIGHHLDLILDFDAIKQKYIGTDVDTLISKMEVEYEEKGYIKRNPNRRQAVISNVRFLKYERILWKALGLIDADCSIQWKKIVEICSLPNL